MTSLRKTGADAIITTAKKCCKCGSLSKWKLAPANCFAILARHDAHWLAKGASNVPAETGDGEDDDEDPFGYGGALDEREEESAQSAHEANPTDYHVNTLVLGSGVVHHTHETWLMSCITFCGKCGAWATMAPRLLTKECAKEPSKRAYELKRLIAGKEPNRRTAWPRDTPLTPARVYLGEEPEPVCR